jgi:internalin A
VRDLSPLFGLRLLRQLEISGNPLDDRQALETLEQRGVAVRFYEPFVSPFDPVLEEAIRQHLGGLKGLLSEEALDQVTFLNFSGPLKTLSGIERLPNLEMLFVRYSGRDQPLVLNDLSPLAGLKKLAKLTVRDSQVSDLTTLGRLVLLDDLNLPNNQIRDIAPLDALARLQFLNLADNQIVDLSPLRRLPYLATINLTNNQVTDLSPLLDMEGLKSVWVRGNPLSAQTRSEHVPALRERGIFVIGL